MTLNETLRTIEDSNKGTERTWLKARYAWTYFKKYFCIDGIFRSQRFGDTDSFLPAAEQKVVMGWLGILLLHFAVRILPWISFEPFLLSLISKHHPLMFSSCFFKTSFWSIFKNHTVVRWLRQWIVT